MIINLNKQFKSLEGKDFEGEQNHIGKTLASALSVSNKGNSILLYDWAMKLWNRESIDVGSTEYDMLAGWVETTEMLNNLCKAQIIAELKSQKEANEKALKKSK